LASAGLALRRTTDDDRIFFFIGLHCFARDRQYGSVRTDEERKKQFSTALASYARICVVVIMDGQTKPPFQDLLPPEIRHHHHHRTAVEGRPAAAHRDDGGGGAATDAPTSNYVSMEMVKANDRLSAAVPTGADNDGEDDDDDDDEHSIARSIVSSVITADGIHDRTGFYCICMVVLVGDMSRGVMFPSMWPLVESLGGSQILLGYSVASFSFGRILVSPLFGSWSHQIGYSKTLLLSTTILIVGTLIYAQIQNIGHPEFLIVAQTVLGIGSGTLGVTRAFVADVTAKRNRTTYMALLTAVQYGGFTVTPFFGSMFSKAFGNTDYQLGPLRLNMFTAPAYFMTLVCSITMVVLVKCFQDRQRIDVAKDVEQKKKSRRRQAIDDVAYAKACFGSITIYDCCILGCMLLNIATKGSIACFETLGIAIAQEHFDMLASRAGVIVAACGSVGVVSLLCMGQLAYYFSDIQLIGGGMLVMASGIWSLCLIEKPDDGVSNPGWKYAVAMFLIYSIGYPIGHTAVIGLFSKSKSDTFCNII